MPRKKEGIYERKNSSYWWASYTDGGGKRTRRSTGVVVSKKGSIAEAKALLAKWVAESHQERMWGVESANEAESKTFDEVMLAYLKGHTVRSKDSRKSSAKLLFMVFGGREMSSITDVEVKEFVRKRLDGTLIEGVKPVKIGTVNRDIGVFAAAINWCNDQLGWQLYNPAEGKKGAEPEGRVRWLEDEAQLKKLIDVAEANKRAPWLADSIYVSMFTGMRWGEVSGLEWSRIDLDRSLIVLETGMTKSGKRRSVHINRLVKAALLRRRNFAQMHCPDSPWVFCNKKGDRVKDMKKSFGNAVREAGITNFTRHDLRHTFASWLCMRGTDLMTIRDALGHSSIKMTERYAHLNPEHVRAEVDKLGLSHFGHTNNVIELKAKATG